MSGRENREGLNRAYGKASFNITVGHATGIRKPVGKQKFTGCTVVSIPQSNGRKPHMAVKNRQGDIIFEVNARQTAAYRTLSEHVGQQLRRFAWEEFDSDFEEGRTYLKCELQTDLRHRLPAGTKPIPRIVLDTETTGLDPRVNEILQLSIIDGDGRTILDRKYKPERNTTWREAERVHHISPRDVADRPNISVDLKEIQTILDRANEICVYNADFDISFLGELGLLVDPGKITDTMTEYGRRYHRTKYWRLGDAAAECGYSYHAHDALEDCRATLAVQRRLDGSIAKPVPEPHRATLAARQRADGKTDKVKPIAQPRTDAGGPPAVTPATPPARLSGTPRARHAGGPSHARRIAAAVLYWTLLASSVCMMFGAFSDSRKWVWTIMLAVLTVVCRRRRRRLRAGTGREQSR